MIGRRGGAYGPALIEPNLACVSKPSSSVGIAPTEGEADYGTLPTCQLTVFQGLRHFPGRWIYCSGSIRARNSSMPARPNMARLSVFNLLIWPSAWPLLHGSAIAFLTASMSRANIRANCCRA